MSGPDIAMRAAWQAAHVSPLWDSPTAHKPDAGPAAPTHWPWTTLEPLARGAAAIGTPAAVERRVLSLLNPHPRWAGDEATLWNLSAAIQILLPGERARPHRHSMNALRFVLQGDGGITHVNQKPCAMAERDMILTPAWTWHEHEHRGSEPLIWLDVLDVPLHSVLGTASFEPGPVRDVPPRVEDAAFASANVVPECPSGVTTAYSPVFHYPWAPVAGALGTAPRARDGSRRVRYVNPLTGGPAMALLDAWVVEIDGGAETTPFRTSSNAVVSIVDGRGLSRVGEHTVAWGPRDVFTIPAGHWVTHRGESAPCRALVVSDREVFRRLDLLTEEWG
jgi:gentisate 1,2-dioxygenase